jgi:serine/threonine protein kinase
MNAPTKTPLSHVNPYSPAPIAVVLPDGTTQAPLGSGVITSVLGEGGAAIVYEIWNEQLQVKRAVKLLRPNAMPTTFDRFSTEVRITAQLRHPNIIQVHTVGEWNKLPYIEMERLEGYSLDKLIQRCGALPLQVSLAIGIMICRALKYTHNHTYAVDDKRYKGVLHRDLKPANVMIADNGVVKLMDFGLATPTDTSMHTIEGTFVGSLQYVAPEQLEGKKASKSSDLYALGAVMYEMLTGKQTFSEKNMTRFVQMRLKNEFTPLRDFNLRTPRSLLKLLNGCLTYEREKRFSDAGGVLDELEKIYGRITKRQPEEMVEYYLKHNKVKRNVSIRHRLPIAQASIALAALVVIGAITFFIWEHQPSKSSIKMATQEKPSMAVVPAVSETVFVEKEKPSVQIVDKKVEVSAKARSKQDRASNRREESLKEKPTVTALAVNAEPAQVTQTFAQTLAAKYGTGDMIAIMAIEQRARNYTTALQIYDSLPAAQQRGKQAMLYKIRALKGAKMNEALATFVEQNVINDAEYYLVKAYVLYRNKRYTEAMAHLDKCRQTQAEYADLQAIEGEALYYRALCLTGIYSISATDQNRIYASEAWSNVKYEFRNNQRNPYFIDADEQIRKLNKQQKDDNW